MFSSTAAAPELADAAESVFAPTLPALAVLFTIVSVKFYSNQPSKNIVQNNSSLKF